MASSSLSLCCLLLLLLPLASLATEGDRSLEDLFEICRLDRISGLQPRQRLESEAGVTELFDYKDKQLQCAGVTVIRRIINSKGLLLPSFFNSPALVYIIEGNGITGLLLPGCPESFQSFEQSSGQQQWGEWQGHSQPLGDEHQRIQYFREGDLLAFPAGVAHWFYNNGDRPVVTITVLDTASSSNQLDRTPRHFLLAGSLKKGGGHGGSSEQSSQGQFFKAFDTRLLAESLGIPQDIAQKIQRDDTRGEMVTVKEGLKFVRPSREKEMFGGDEELEMENKGVITGGDNGMKKALCNYRLRENINNPQRADFYNPKAGWLTKLNSQKLPILRLLKLSARRGVMRARATTPPHWLINAHAIMYVTKGRARVQIASDEGKAVHDGEVRQGQLLVVPQNYVVLIKAEEEGFEWVAFKTSENAIDSKITGKSSIFKGLPVDVLANAYRLQKEEALKLKYGRMEELEIFQPSEHRGRLYAAE